MRIPASLGSHMKLYTAMIPAMEKLVRGHGPLAEIFTLDCDVSATCLPLSAFHCEVRVFQLVGNTATRLFGCRIYLHFNYGEA